MSLTTLDPLTLEVVAEVQAASRDEALAARERARRAATTWAATAMKDRIRMLRAVGDEWTRRAEEVVRALGRENGKPEAEAWGAEVLANIDLFAYHLRHSTRHLRAERVKLDPIAYPGKRGVVRLEPRGTILLISPWNFPFAIPLRTLVPALLSGNTVVWKPSEHAILCTRLLHEMLKQHLPEGVLEVVYGAGDVGALLTSLPWGRVVFVGSVRTGRAVARACAETLTPVSLELGGKDAAIVLADADLERTANGLLWGACFNAGQNCAGIERAYVEEKVLPELRDRLVKKAAELRLRAPGVPGGDVGPLTTDFQKVTVSRQLAEAIAAGAKVLSGGKIPGQRLVEPTILEDVPETCAVLSDETFGPVLPLIPVASAEEAVARANASRYGLTASLWTRDYARAAELAKRLETGVVTVNNHAFTGAVPDAPWSGVKDTGYGVTNSKHALLELVRPVLYLEDRSRARREPWWYPYDEDLLAIMKGMWRLRSPGLMGKLAGLRQLLRHFPRRLRRP